MGADGVPHLPGSVVPETGWPLSVKLLIDSGDDQVLHVDWVEADGDVVATSTDLSGSQTLLMPSSGAVYGRVQGSDGRLLLWISPFFLERS